MTRRKLRPDEIELWQKVARTAESLHPDRPASDLPLPKPRPHKKPMPRIERFDLGHKAGIKAPGHDVLPGLPERIAAAPVKMDKKAFARLKRGKLVPEAKIDLHGMTLDRAHPALTGFILRAHADGKRLVLVITGKGKDRDEAGPIPVRRGILRHNVPRWLSQQPLAPLVLQVSEAHLKHGGGGAYYVYLRRHR
ncbi:putative DNA endonuclease SmrA [Roseovarius litorisediminis]|uniref:Putative DNA endonuclease SmrA n=1 Tax=Roseovarius litorisediminis TaxID=1312363 RepID=A0A1Y5SNN4_9RHOB|nr:Smr/MutS family protein [Roseovarius litorisediminis]SLN43686.1 putative DNA endonuclease SmrA [Roseovarius litorisediminis]